MTLVPTGRLQYRPRLKSDKPGEGDVLQQEWRGTTPREIKTGKRTETVMVEHTVWCDVPHRKEPVDMSGEG